MRIYKRAFPPIILLILSLLVSPRCSSTKPSKHGELTWENLGGPYQGTIRSVYISEESGILVGTGGIYRSLDNGSTWEIALEVGCRLITSAAGEYLWAVTSEGLHRSDDAGSNWEVMSTLVEEYWGAVVGIGDSTVIVASTSSLVYRSFNLGMDWEEAGYGLNHPVRSYSVGVWDLLNINECDLLAGTHAGIYKSEDMGLTWNRFSSGFADDQVDPSVSALSLGMDSDSTLYAGSWIGVGVYKSIDEGNTWEYSGLDSVATMIMVPYEAGTLLAGTSSGIYATFDHGNSWFYLGLSEIDVRAIAMDTRGRIYAGGVHHGALWRASPDW